MLKENYILTLIKSISVLYFDNISKDKGTGIAEEITEIISNIKINPNPTGIGSEETAISALLYTTNWMLTSMQTESIIFTRDNIIQRLMINIHCDNEYIEVTKKYLDENITAVDARKRVTEIMSELRYDKKQLKIRQLIHQANTKLNFGIDTVDTGSYVQSLMSELEGLSTNTDGEVNGFIGRINFLNSKEIDKVLKKTTESYSPEGILSTGFQGLNKSTGVGGFKRGEMINFGATTHNYKSGILIDLAVNIPMFNNPWMWDNNKKPLILRISFENTIEQDIGIMYKKLHEIKYQEPCILSEVNTMKASKLLAEQFGQTGYHFSLESFDPNNFSVYNLFDVINRYLNNGYEIHAISCDYLTQIAPNTLGDRGDVRIQKTYEMVRNFCHPKGITFLTAHQLSTEASTLQRDHTSTFTRKVCTGGWYMDCKSLHTKLDLEYILGIHKHQNGEKFLAFSRGKHRGGESTPDAHCHFYRKFEQFGGIVPDVGKDDKTYYRLPELLDTSSIGIWD